MHDIRVLQNLIQIIKENYKSKNHFAPGEAPYLSSKMIEEIQKKILETSKANPADIPSDCAYIPASLIYEVGKYLKGEVPRKELFTELENSKKVSRYGLDYSVATQLLAFTKLAAYFEQSGNAEENAYKLAVIFNDTQRALDYLSHFIASYKTEKEQPFHDALIFTMPENDQWDLNAWRQIFVKHMNDDDFRNRLLAKIPQIQSHLLSTGQASIARDENEGKALQALAAKLQEKTKEQGLVEANLRALHQKAGALSKAKQEIPLDLSKAIQEQRDNIPKLKKEINQIQQQIKAEREKLIPLLETLELKVLAQPLAYQNANKDEAAAELFLKYGVSESVFEEYLRIKSQIKDSDKQIPPVFLEGKKYGCDDCYLIKLKKGDPKGAVLGHITACCQSLDKLGSGSAHHGITSENAGFYILCKGKPPADGDTSKILPKDIIAQSWAWRGKDGALVFDSVESQPNMRKQYENKISSMFNALAFELVDSHAIPVVKVGRGATPSTVGYKSKSMPLSTPIDYKGYGDSKIQREVANHQYSLLPLFAADIGTAIARYNALPKEVQNQYNEKLILERLLLKATPEQFSLYLKSKGDIDIQDYILSHDLLEESIVANNKALAQYFLSQGEKIQKSIASDLQIVTLSLSHHLPEVAKKMIDLIEAYQEVSKESLLVLAATSVHVEMVKRLLKEDSAKASASQALSQLVKSSTRGDFENKKQIAEALIAAGASLPNLLSEKYDDECMRFIIEKIALKETQSSNRSEDDANLFYWAVKVGSDNVIKKLLAEDCVFYQQRRGFALYTAISLGNTQVTELLLQRGFAAIENGTTPIDAQDESGSSLLMYAVQSDNAALVKALLEKNAKCDLKDKAGMSVFHLAAQAGKTKNLELLLEYHPAYVTLDEVNTDGKSPLMLAEDKKHYETVRYLVLCGANYAESLNSFNSETRLDAAEEGLKLSWETTRRLLPRAAEGKHKILIRRILLDWYHEIITKPQNLNNPEAGKTLLMWAARTGNVFLVQELLALGADVNVVDSEGNSALHLAAEQGYAEIVRLLAEKKAPLFLKNNRDTTPLASLKNKYVILRLNAEEDVIARFEIKMRETRKHIISAWSKEVIEAMLGNSALNPSDPEGKTLLMWASELGLMDVLQQLIAQNISLDDKDSDQKTALNYAVEHGQLEAVSLLLQHGASLNDKITRSILDHPNIQILEKLIKAGHSFKKEDLAEVEMKWRSPQAAGFREVRAIILENIFLNACRNNDIAELKTLLEKDYQLEIPADKLINILLTAVSSAHVETVRELLSLDNVIEEVRGNETVLRALMANEKMKEITKEALKKEEPPFNPFIKKETLPKTFQTEQSKLEALRAKLWEDLYKDVLLIKAYPSAKERSVVVEKLARSYAAGDVTEKKAAIREVVHDESKVAQVLSLLEKHMPAEEVTTQARQRKQKPLAKRATPRT